MGHSPAVAAASATRLATAAAVAVVAVTTVAVAATAAAVPPAAAAAVPPPAIAPIWRTLPGVAPLREESSLARCGAQRLCMTGDRKGAPVDILTLPTGGWSTGAAPPLPLHHTQDVLDDDGCVWKVGAYTGKHPRETAVDRIWTYCADGGGGGVGGVWAARPGIIDRPRGGGGAAWHRGKLYLVGGLVDGHLQTATTVGWTDVYDPATGAWTAAPDMPHRRDHFGVAVVGDELFAVGGRVSGLADGGNERIVPEVDVFDMKTQTWGPPSAAPPPLPLPRSKVGVTTFNGSIIVAGGEDLQAVYPAVHALHAASRTWTMLPPLLTARHGMGLVACAGTGALFTAGGSAQHIKGNPVGTAEGFYPPAGAPPATCGVGGGAATPPLPPPPTRVPTSGDGPGGGPRAPSGPSPGNGVDGGGGGDGGGVSTVLVGVLSVGAVAALSAVAAGGGWAVRRRRRRRQQQVAPTAPGRDGGDGGENGGDGGGGVGGDGDVGGDGRRGSTAGDRGSQPTSAAHAMGGRGGVPAGGGAPPAEAAGAVAAASAAAPLVGAPSTGAAFAGVVAAAADGCSASGSGGGGGSDGGRSGGGGNPPVAIFPADASVLSLLVSDLLSSGSYDSRLPGAGSLYDSRPPPSADGSGHGGAAAAPSTTAVREEGVGAGAPPHTDGRLLVWGAAADDAPLPPPPAMPAALQSPFVSLCTTD